jgi:pimeloyl-ACP methyl ester carboxylesterase
MNNPAFLIIIFKFSFLTTDSLKGLTSIIAITSLIMGSRHLILIHGFLEDASMWNHLLPHLSKKDYIISTPELPGHGHNEIIPAEKTAAAYCDAILQQLHLQPEDTALIIGHSMGGYLATTLVQQMPCKVRALCLFHSKAGADSPQKITDRRRAIEAARENKALYVRTMINGIYGEKNRTTCAPEIEKQIAYASGLTFETIEAAQLVMISRADNIESMKQRNFSLYYYLGDIDSSLPLEIMKQELDQLPGAVAHIAHDIGHMGHIERTREAADFIQRILRAEL